MNKTSNIDEILNLLSVEKDSKEFVCINKALALSEQFCQDSTISGTEKTPDNCLELALIAASELGLGSVSVVAILLNEPYSSNAIDEQMIREEFSKSVLQIVQGLEKISEIDTKKVYELNIEEENTKKQELKKSEKKSKRIKSKKHLSFEGRLAIQSENFIKMLLALSEDVRVIMIKIAYQLFHIRRIKELSPNDQIALSREAAYLYAPIAHKLGLYKVKTELEEIAMKYNHPDMYRYIANKLDQSKKNRTAFMEWFIEPIKKELTSRGFSCEVKGRPKSIHSIWNKIKKQNVDFEGIYDLFAIRIILKNKFKTIAEEKDACWRVYSLITNVYSPNPKRLRDWISAPKSSGYESLHTTVMVEKAKQKWVEVQIRTERMDEIAEKGNAAHWKYKEVASTDGHDAWLEKIRNLLENPENKGFEQDDEAKMDLYSNKIFAFTPKGELIALPEEATVLDFAYYIHSKIGDQCVGAKINNRVVSIRHRVLNGNTVEILTSKQQKPKKEWKQFVVTSRARNRIKRALKSEQNYQARKGRDEINMLLSTIGLEMNDKIIGQMRNYFDFTSNIDFFAAAGRGELDLEEGIEELYVQEHRDNDEILEEINKIKKNININRSKEYLIVDNLGKIDYELAKCCSPIPGDKIFGFVTVHKGTKIHKLNCPNATDMMSRYPYRVVKAFWNNMDLDSVFPAKIHIIGANSTTLFSNILNVISKDLRIDLRDANVNSEKGKMFDGEFVVYVSNTSHLETLITKIESLKGVISVTREEL